MNSDKKKDFVVSGRFTSGTAKQVVIQSIIPNVKAEKELFWAKLLLDQLADYYDYSEIKSNPDDSHGNHDVIVTLKDNSIIGIQVTELTYELKRSRNHIRDTFLKSILKEIINRDLKTDKKVLFSITFPFVESKKPLIEKPQKIVDIIEQILSKPQENKLHEYNFGNIYCSSVLVGDFYIPSINNIGVDVNIDKFPSNLDKYVACIEAIETKKRNSLSDWLLIWSVEFWHDKHWIEKEILQTMKSQFINSSFKKVFFIEALDGDKLLQANLKVNEIK